MLVLLGALSVVAWAACGVLGGWLYDARARPRALYPWRPPYDASRAARDAGFGPFFLATVLLAYAVLYLGLAWGTAWVWLFRLCGWTDR
jgi:hypothetical protein